MRLRLHQVWVAMLVVAAAATQVSGQGIGQTTVGPIGPTIMGLNDRHLHFVSTEKFEQWERHEGAWEEEGEFERRAVRRMELAPLAEDCEVWMNNVHAKPGDGRAIPTVELFAKKPGENIEQRVMGPTDLPKGTALRLKLVQPHEWTLTQHAYWPARSRIQIYARPAGVKHELVARITWTRGNVYLKTADGEQHLVKPGTELTPGDVIMTGEDAVAELLIYPKNSSSVLIRMKPNTTCVIQKPKDGTPRKIGFFEMLWGKIWCKAEKGSEFEVKIPRAVAGVRGTEFTVSHGEVGSAVAVFEGVVEVTGDAGNAALEPGQGAAIDDAGAVATAAVGPEDNWGREQEWSTIIAEDFATLDEGRWEKWAMFSGSVEGVSVTDGRLVLSDEGGGGFSPCGITTREKALRWAIDDPMVVELRTAASELSEHGEVNAGMVTGSPVERDWERAWYPWDVWGPVLKMTRGGAGVWLYMPGREKVLTTDAAAVADGARMVIERGEKEGEGTVTLTDLQGTVLGTYEGRLGSEFNAGGLWYANVWGYAWPEGEALEAVVDAVWLGPLSQLGKPVEAAVVPGPVASPIATATESFVEEFTILDDMRWLELGGQVSVTDGVLRIEGANAALMTVEPAVTVPAANALLLEMRRPSGAVTVGLVSAEAGTTWVEGCPLAMQWTAAGITVMSPATGRTVAGPMATGEALGAQLVVGHQAMPGHLVVRVIALDGTALGAGLAEANGVVAGSQWHIGVWQDQGGAPGLVDSIWAGAALER